jgi:hypothetical protein
MELLEGAVVLSFLVPVLDLVNKIAYYLLSPVSIKYGFSQLFQFGVLHILQGRCWLLHW